MKIAIVGAGLTGLTAGYRLSKNGHLVTILEKGNQSGGLAAGFKENNWDWNLEFFYHHLFTSDTVAANLLEELGVKEKLFFERPKSSILYNGKISQFDSPLSLLSFEPLSIESKLRTGLATLYLKFQNNWPELERITAKEWLIKFYGKQAFEVLWEPLLKSKFQNEAENISMAWFWARIKKRSNQLGYIEGGFKTVINKLEEKISNQQGKLLFNQEIKNLKDIYSKYDSVIVTIPTEIFSKLTPELPKDYKEKLSKLKMAGAISVVLELKNQFLTDGTYWLNVNDSGFPFVAVVEHTNFIDKTHYGNNRILYIGGYYPQDHRYFKTNDKEILEEFLLSANKINPKFNFKLQISNFKLVKSLYAQPIVPINYSKLIPKYDTPIPNVFLANMQQIYPWDRGTNYAIELGEKIAKQTE